MRNFSQGAMEYGAMNWSDLRFFLEFAQSGSLSAAARTRGYP